MDNEAIINADEPVIYVGPNSFELMMKKFQVFTGGLPLYVKRAIEQIPKIERLIVPVSQLEEMRAKIEKSGTYEARTFYDVEKEIGKLKAKGK